MSEREERLARNEVYFRDLNERVQEHVKDVVGEDATFNILCECASLSCVERIPVTSAEYEAAHENPRQFLVAIGHVQVDIEDSLLQTERFELVRKRDEAGDVAARSADA